MSEEIAQAAVGDAAARDAAAEIAELRRALDVALAELERSRPVVIAAARLAAGPDMQGWAALYAALDPPRKESL